MSLERIYLSQAEGALASWLAGPRLAPGFTGFALTLKAEDAAGVGAAVAFRDRCVAAGLECLIGFRVAETFAHAAHCCERRYWDESAATLERLRLVGVTRIHIDAEAYGVTVGKVPSKAVLTSLGRTVAQLREAMLPFLGALGAFSRVHVYPASPDDEVVAAIADTMLGRCELWIERFDLAAMIMRDPHRAEHYALEMARRRAQIQRRFPASACREGDYDWYSRAVGNEARRSWLDSYGPLEPWVFLEHQHADETMLGSQDWYDGVRLGAGNRVAHAWAFASAAGEPRQVRTSDTPIQILRASTAPETPSTVLSSLGYRLTDARYGRASSVLPPISPITLAFDGEVPQLAIPLDKALMRPVIGESQSNADSWCVVHDGYDLFLRLAAAAPGGAQEWFRLGPYTRGRFAISRLADKTWIYTPAQGAEVAVTPSKPVRLGAGHLYVGLCGVGGGLTSSRLHDGLVIARAEVHTRETSAEERAAIVSMAYPRE